MAAGAAMSWFIGAHFGYLAYIALTVGNVDRAIMWGIFADMGPTAMYLWPVRDAASRNSSGQRGEP